MTTTPEPGVDPVPEQPTEPEITPVDPSSPTTLPETDPEPLP